MQLNNWIEEVGVKKIAHLLDVTPQSVYEWVGLRGAPSSAKAWEIIKLSHGLVTWESIYQPYYSKVEESNGDQNKKA
jgi:DNA-binding transcriptional regulator YdaS (Cro superfamily)